jgi:acyl-CoA reductase-like NAD-dependent aldehyde dehydrogenase
MTNCRRTSPRCSSRFAAAAGCAPLPTEEALWAVARAYPDVADELVEAARAAFAGQLDGSNARARRVALEQQFEEMRRRHA